MSFTCESSLLLPCRDEPIGRCEYCDKRFCARHGRVLKTTIPYRSSDTFRVCARHLRLFHREEQIWSRWQAGQKKRDADLAARAQAGALRNAEGKCAFQKCQNPPKYACDSIPGSCDNRFCHLHIRDAFVRVCPDCDRFHAQSRRAEDERSREVTGIREPFGKF